MFFICLTYDLEIKKILETEIISLKVFPTMMKFYQLCVRVSEYLCPLILCILFKKTLQKLFSFLKLKRFFENFYITTREDETKQLRVITGPLKIWLLNPHLPVVLGEIFLCSSKPQ